MMMVVAGGDEGGFLAVARLQGEAEDADIEAERPLDVGDLQVDMSDVDARVYRRSCHEVRLLGVTHPLAQRRWNHFAAFGVSSA